MEIIITFISQAMFQYFRTSSTFSIFKNKDTKLYLNTAIVQLLWLISSAYGINGIMTHNYNLAISYIIGGVFGTFLSVKMNKDYK